MPWIEAHEINHGKNLVNDEIIENDGSEPEKPINPTPESNQVEEEIDLQLQDALHYFKKLHEESMAEFVDENEVRIPLIFRKEF